jgi:hypothetical protein
LQQVTVAITLLFRGGGKLQQIQPDFSALFVFVRVRITGHVQPEEPSAHPWKF